MRKLGSYLILILLIALFSNSVFASTNEICDPLKADGVTKGLYGLCIAYHASGANSQVLLDNYNKKKSSSDPVMPGTDDNPPTLSCLCWNSLTIDNVGSDPALSPSSCSLDPVDNPGFYEIEYSNGGDPGNVLFERLTAGPGGCVYSNLITGVDSSNFELSGEEADICQAEIYGLAVVDFGGFDCLP